SVKIKTIQEFLIYQEALKRKTPEKVLIVSNATCGRAHGSLALVDKLKELWEKKALKGKAHLRFTGCLGYCDCEPLVIVRPSGFSYPRPSPEDLEEIIDESLIGGKPVERLFLKDPASGEVYHTENEIPFYKQQKMLIFGDNFELDPTSLEDYICLGGYSSLVKALTQMKPGEIIEEITKSGLRGRGGAGFPTGPKWASCRKAEGKHKYVICNADEGDPGSYANRGLLEGNPHSCIEGMIIGAYAIGADEGYVYIRMEYPLAVELIEKAIHDCLSAGLLGNNILGTGFDFDIKITRGGGAYVCGESTALMASIEGRPGEPRAKHIHTVERGLWDSPSTLNNVETWANIPKIIQNGADWFTKIGTGDVSKSPWDGSKGTKIFSLVGNIHRSGLAEVPMGMTLREVIFDIGGGMKGGKRFKGVQTGGPSGGVLGEEHLDLQIDYELMAEAGSIMGSGGMIVMDENTCMVDLARYFMGFLMDESCGKCIPCREGITQIYQILDKICKGLGEPEDLELLKDLVEVLENAALCQLGLSAPNPILTTMKYFKEEYDAHIYEHVCPAGVCKALSASKVTALT
ncbi:MAG TPA: NuoF family protein, partial [archaeon]|nr:NuoF family protein [archaeon]